MKEGPQARQAPSEASLDPVEVKKPLLRALRGFSEQFSGQWQRPQKAPQDLDASSPGGKND